MPDEIVLTTQELAEIKITERYREKVTLTLKILHKRIDDLNGYCKKVPLLETHIKIHYWLISLIMAGIISSLFWVIRANAGR